MKRLLSLLAVVVILLMGDTIVSMLLATVYGIIQSVDNDFYEVISYPESALLLNLWRLVYLLLPTLLLFWLLSAVICFKSKLLQVSVISVLTYLTTYAVVALLYKSFTDFSANALFYIVGLSTLLSPCIVSQVPALKRLLARL